MTIVDIILCGNLTATLFILWYLKTLREDLDDLEDFSVSVLIEIAKKLEIEIEERIDTSD